MRWLLTISFFGGFLFASETGFAQTVRRPQGYDKLDAGYEAYQLGEQRRRYAIGRQVWLNDEMIFWSRSFPSWRYFAEPWPFLLGDIYGYPLAESPIHQPVGRVEEQIGPNTWFSRPVFTDDFEPAIEGETAEWLENDATNPPAPFSGWRSNRGPREF